MFDAAVDLVEVVDNVALNRNALLEANAVASELRSRVEAASTDSGANHAALSALSRMFLASDEQELDGLWDVFAAQSVSGGIDTSLGEEIYIARGQQLALLARSGELALAFDGADATLSSLRDPPNGAQLKPSRPQPWSLPSAASTKDGSSWR